MLYVDDVRMRYVEAALVARALPISDRSSAPYIVDRRRRSAVRCLRSTKPCPDATGSWSHDPSS